MSVEHMHVICGKSQYYVLSCVFVTAVNRPASLLKNEVNIFVIEIEKCVRAKRRSAVNHRLSHSSVEFNLWWEDNVLRKGKKAWKTTSKDPNPMSNFVNNGTVDDTRTNRNGTTRKQKTPRKKSRTKWMRHSHQGISSEYIHLSGVYIESAWQAGAHTPFKVKLRLIQSLSHDITSRGISVRPLRLTLSSPLSWFFLRRPIPALPSLKNEKNQFLKVVRRLLVPSPCAMHGRTKRPRIQIHFAFISFLVSTCDVFISLNVP